MKDAYYFSHDSNAHSDPKITKLLLEMKASGYGIYWVIIEMLRNEPNYTLSLVDINAVAYQSHCDISDVNKVIRDFGLFTVDETNKFFYSESLNRRMEELDIKRDKARTSANTRWYGHANALRMQSDGNAVKESKVKESKTTIQTMFLEFWSEYPRKVAKPNALKAFLKLSPNDELLQLILKGVEIQSKTDQWQKDNGQFIPHPATWLNQRRWEDEIKKTNDPYSNLPNQKF